ncbi:MAG: sigma 54-interacting transcriptional regulator [Bacillota bacterium]
MEHQLLLAILDSTYNAIVAINTSGQVIAFNLAAEKIVGVPASHALKRHITEIIPETRLLEILQTGSTETNQKMVINGRTIISNRSAIRRGEEIIGAVGVFQDISDIEEVLGEMEAYQNLVNELQAIIEYSNDGIYITDGKGKTLRVNSAYEKMSGIGSEEVVGRDMKALVKDRYFSESVTLKVLESKSTETILQKTRYGKILMVTGNPVFDENGSITMVVTNVRDITQLNNLQEQLKETSGLTRGYQQALSNLSVSETVDMVMGRSQCMRDLMEHALHIAPFPTTVLIEGESGVGKELIAAFIHKHSTRAAGPFIRVNCAAIPEALLESELFGYEPGAFTGAQAHGKPGLLELANEGTMLMDEVSEMPLNLQAKLLRVLQEKEVLRVGGIKYKKLDVRVIATTNLNLQDMVHRKLFRKDLYYRLNVVRLTVPPLRNRREDILELAEFFLKKYSQEYGLDKRLSRRAMDCFVHYDWPGNVRELRHLIENLVISTIENLIDFSHLPSYMYESSDPERKVVIKGLCSLRDAVHQTERQLLEMALGEYGSIRKAAAVLGIHHATLLRKMRAYDPPVDEGE